MMNEWDKDNLNFIMNASEEGFDEWLEQADNDDIDYALELIRMAKAELMVQEMEMTDADLDQDIDMDAFLSIIIEEWYEFSVK